MGLNAKEFADKHKISSKKIKAWYDKGYLGAATKDEKTGVYNIPDDTPVPYTADSRIKCIPKFWRELLDAAQNQNSVFPSMYPHLNEGVFASQLENFVNAGLINLHPTQSGTNFLEITTAGYEFMNTLCSDERKKIYEQIERKISTGVGLVQAICAVIPVLQQFWP